ncbi:YheC/YheD family protein [Bacillus sp. MUM 13]|uniref:YheC/YheD family endospore coat-associated protein n=1 Tax=Bacillus sp. MUM 13 TaxID=1678001 RepID=UPI0008F5B66C|nr:YheC/YheD family protein [Bacillus sp. MUM 13]OIK14897.1 alpha-L-glutamate ligase [Bacillus sp. MUM 13]
MILIGMLHHRENPEKVIKAYAYNAVAKAEGADFFYFTPGKVNISTETITGKTYENGKWIEKEFPYPEVIYNASPPISEKASEIYEYLAQRIPFTSHSIGNKVSVFNRIKSGKNFSQYLIPTIEANNARTVFDVVDTYTQVIFKPVTGRQGGGILYIEKEDENSYKVNEAGSLSNFSKSQLQTAIKERIEERDYLIQPFITCKIKSGHVYDLRLHVQRDGEGEWNVTSIYPRIGPLGSVTSNISSGGYSCLLDEFLKNEFEDYWYNIKRSLEKFAVLFSRHFAALYDNISFDEFGIDVGIDKNQKFWIFEVNWRPGIPVIFNGELDVARNTIQYAKYLAKSKSERKTEQP